jgi:hypothetical protein
MDKRRLYRAVDSTGQTIDFLLTLKRDAAAAKRFFRKALSQLANPQPGVINVDKSPAYQAAIEQLQTEGTLRRRCWLRQCKYLNNVVEQDHRFVKQRVWLAKGYGSFPSAWRTLQGIEALNMIRKGRARWVGKRDVVGQVRFIGNLFGLTGIASLKILPDRCIAKCQVVHHSLACSQRRDASALDLTVLRVSFP